MSMHTHTYGHTGTHTTQPLILFRLRLMQLIFHDSIKVTQNTNTWRMQAANSIRKTFLMLK